MVRLVLGALFILLSVVFVVFYRREKTKLSKGESLRPDVKHGLTGACIVSALIGMFLWATLSFVIVGKDELGHLNRIFLGGPMKSGQIVALDGQKGPQARTIPPGFHLQPFIRLLYKVEMKKDIEIEAGFCGVLIAQDGAPLREGQIFADKWPEESFEKMLDATYFLTHGGQKGPQLSVLKPGLQKFNQYLFKYKPVPVTDVKAGFVGVVKSNVQEVPIDPEKLAVIKAYQVAEGLVAPVVPRGYFGIWEDVFFPGQYYINPDAYEVKPIDTRVQTWEYAGGFKRRWIDMTLDQNGQIQQKEGTEDFPVPDKAADMAITARVEGWLVPIDARVLVQVTPKDAPYVVASVGGIEEVENKVLTPVIRSVVRNVTGDPSVKVLDLIEKRSQLESAVEKDIIPEGRKTWITIKEIRFGDPALPPELMVSKLREQLAQQLKVTFEQEKIAQEQRILTEKSKAEADQQPKLVEAQIKKEAAEFEKEAAKLKGEGEKLFLTEMAEGQKLQTEVLGQDRVMQLAMLKEILEAVVKNPEIVKVPGVLVQGATAGFEGAAAILGASNITRTILKPSENVLPSSVPENKNSSVR